MFSTFVATLHYLSQFDPEFIPESTRKLESTQYTAALAVSGAWRGTNRNKLYEELGWEYLYHRR